MRVIAKSHSKLLSDSSKKIVRMINKSRVEVERSIKRSLARDLEQEEIKRKEKSEYERVHSERSAEAVRGVANLMQLASDKGFEKFYTILAKLPGDESNFYFIFEKWNPNAEYGSIGYGYAIEFKPGLLNFYVHFPDSRDDRCNTILDTDDFARNVALYLNSSEDPGELMENWRPYEKSFATLRQCQDINFVQQQFTKAIKEKLKSIKSR